VLEIAGREANGSCGCAPVGCGTARAGPPLNAGHWSAWAIAAGQERGVVPRLCRCGGRGTKRAPFLASPSGELRARDAGVLSSSSDPS
jgi:hypothetical protein